MLGCPGKWNLPLAGIRVGAPAQGVLLLSDYTLDPGKQLDHASQHAPERLNRDRLHSLASSTEESNCA